ncbi:MAG: NHL repeat-containing protein [Acidobacteriaceae bacterium]
MNKISLYVIFLVSVNVVLMEGCGGGNTPATPVTPSSTINTYVAGSFCFGNAIDSAGNIWVANEGNGSPGTALGESNVTELSPSGTVIGTYLAGSVPIGIAIDKSGNVWVENYGNGIPGKDLGKSNVTELSSSGTFIGTYKAGSYPAGGIAVDTSGNVWVTNWGAPSSGSSTPGTPGLGAGESNVTELSSSGAWIGTYVAGSSPGGIAIDSAGNVWVANKGDGIPGVPGPNNSDTTNSNVTKLSPSGATLGIYAAGSFPEGLAIDPDGNVWVVNKGNGIIGIAPKDSNVTELSPSGSIIGTYAVGSYPEVVAIDSAGNAWVTNGYGQGGVSPTYSSVTELSPSGDVIHTYATGFQPYSIAIDKSGNVWVTNYGSGMAGTTLTDSNVQEYVGAAKGPQYFPYSGPQWPGAE